jgi:TetR/AcrR family transcriptional regulator, lmrAB and yxaGH operons repressor
MAKQSTKTLQTRTRLLDTAGQLFRAQGFHATGLDEVLRLSGTPKGSLYHYFPGGKDQLAIAALDHVVTQMKQRMLTLLASSDDPPKALRTLLDFMAKSLAESDFRNGCPVAALTVDVACDRDSVREACERCFNIWLEVLAEHFKRAGHAERRAKNLAVLFLAALEGGAILSRAQKNVAPLNAIADELVQLIRNNSVPRREQGAPKTKPRSSGTARR